MKILLSLVFAATLLAPSLASACEKGERAVGPVCVRTGELKAGNKTYIVNQAYFKADDSKAVVWEGVGYVEKVTKKVLVAIEPVFNENLGQMIDDLVEYRWSDNAKKYVR